MNAARRFTLLGGAAVIAISAALWLTGQRNRNDAAAGGLLLPGLARELNSVTQVSILKAAANPVVTLRKQADSWTVAERADYPADVRKLRQLLLNLGDAKIIEKKTADPVNFPIIGVEDPTQAGAAGAQLEVSAASGVHSIIVGKAVGEGNFVRRGGENQSYIVEPGIVVDADPHAWIDGKLLDIPVADIQTLKFTSPAGPNYSLQRLPAADPGAPAQGFSLSGIPPGRKAADAPRLSPSPAAFGTLSAEDVTAIATLDFSQPTLLTLTMTDGTVITLTGVAAADKHWLLVASSKDPVLNAKTAGRAFEIPGYRFDGIFRPLEQLLVPKEPAAMPTRKPANAPKQSTPKP